MLLIVSFSLYICGKDAFCASITKSTQRGVNKEIANRLSEGRRYYNLKQYNLAIYEWELALSLDPDNKKIKKNITDAQGRLQKAVNAPADLISVVAPLKQIEKTLTLENCIDIAVKNSYQLKISEKQISLSRSRILEAKRNLLPKLSLNFEESYGRVQGRRYYGKKEFVEGSHTIFKGGELVYTLKQAALNLEVEKATYEKTRNELILQVKKSYYGLWKAKENLKMQLGLAQEADSVYEMVKKGSDAGVLSKLEFLNVGSQASQIHYQLESATGDEAVAELVLKQVMNLDLRQKIDIEPVAGFKKFEVDFDTTLRMAYMNRPEMRINSLTLEYYGYDKRIAGAKAMPKIDLMGSWGLAKEIYLAEDNRAKSDGTTDPFRKLEDQWYVGAKVQVPFWGSTAEFQQTREQWPPVVSAFHGTESTTNTAKVYLLDKLGMYADKKQADIDWTKAASEFEKLKQDITVEVREGCFAYEKAILQLETASNKIKYQEKDLELARFKRGMDEVQDSAVIESMIKTTQERFGYIQAVSDYHTAVASLNKAIGINDYFKPEEKAG